MGWFGDIRSVDSWTPPAISEVVHDLVKGRAPPQPLSELPGPNHAFEVFTASGGTSIGDFGHALPVAEDLRVALGWTPNHSRGPDMSKVRNI